MDRKVRIAIPIGKSKVGLTIYTPNQYLLDMISLNWGKEDYISEKELNLYLATDTVRDYSVERMDKEAWICKGVYNYSALKIAIRGVLSDADIEDTIFVHGCCFGLLTQGREKGIILAGASGAGKTTLVSALVKRYDSDFRVVNDDWGAMGISDKIAVSTEEKYFHMKIGSAMAINPDFKNELMLMQEEYRDGVRGLVLPDAVYPYRIKQTKIDTWVILICDRGCRHYFRNVETEEALEVIANGAYSPFYNRKERFMNGSLILDSKAKEDFHVKILKHALQNINLVVINNTGSRDDLYNDFQKVVESTL